MHDKDLYHARITPDHVPPDVAERVLSNLNGVRDPEELARAVPLLEPRVSGEHELASRVLQYRDGEHSGRFPDLDAVAAVSGLSAGRFGELVTDLGTEPQVYEPDMSTDAPGRRGFSASRSELEFTYELLQDVGSQPAGTQSHVTAARCTSCVSSQPSYVGYPDRYEARVDVTKAIFDGEDDFAQINVTMDGTLTPYDYMFGLQEADESFTFPAIMHLNNNMVLHVRLKESGDDITLVSKRVTAQVGKIFAWPPYGMRLHTLEPSEYHIEGDPDETPVLRVLDGTTFLTGPSNFLGHHADILSHELRLGPSDEIEAVDLRWRPVPEDTEYERQADYYRVYRAAIEDPTAGDPGEAAWELVSGPVKSPEWRDSDVPPGVNAVYYRVVAVWVTSLGKAFESFPGQSVRVEPPGSKYRTPLPLGIA